MFDINQTIMLMGAAGTTDVSAHLSNANAKSSSEPQIEANGVSVAKYCLLSFCLFLDVFGDRFEKFGQYLLR